MSKPYQPPTQQSIDALAAAIVVFVVELAQAIFSFRPEHTRRRLHRAIQRAERAVEVMLFLMALRLAGPPPKSHVSTSRRNTPRGYSRRTKRSMLLFKYARMRQRHCNFYLRVARLIEASAHPMRHVRRFLSASPKACAAHASSLRIHLRTRSAPTRRSAPSTRTRHNQNPRPHRRPIPHAATKLFAAGAGVCPHSGAQRS